MDIDRMNAIGQAEARAALEMDAAKRAKTPEERERREMNARLARAEAQDFRERILQIIPADGWQAVYKEDDGVETFSPLVCFALVERMESNGACEYSVEPMDYADYVDKVADNSNFLRIERASSGLAQKP